MKRYEFSDAEREALEKLRVPLAVYQFLNKRVVTISLTIEFMHAVMTNTPRVFTEATVLHDGRKTMVCECRIVDAKGKLYAKANATFFVTGKLFEDE